MVRAHTAGGGGRKIVTARALTLLHSGIPIEKPLQRMGDSSSKLILKLPTTELVELGEPSRNQLGR